MKEISDPEGRIPQIIIADQLHYDEFPLEYIRFLTEGENACYELVK